MYSLWHYQEARSCSQSPFYVWIGSFRSLGFTFHVWKLFSWSFSEKVLSSQLSISLALVTFQHACTCKKFSCGDRWQSPSLEDLCDHLWLVSPKPLREFGWLGSSCTSIPIMQKGEPGNSWGFSRQMWRLSPRVSELGPLEYCTFTSEEYPRELECCS